MINSKNTSTLLGASHENKKADVMKKHLYVVILLVSAIALSFAQEASIPEYMLAIETASDEEVEPDVTRLAYNPSFTKGKADAELLHPSSGYFLGGVASGLLFGLLGTAVIGFAAGGDTPDYIPDDVDTKGYMDGYFKKAKSKNRSAAWMGGLIGTAIRTGAFVVIAYGDQRD
jgi:hypothetical protein